MTKQISVVAGALFSLGLTTAATVQETQLNPPDRLTVNINTQQTAQPVSKYEFGMFIEHIGPLIYRSLWSEMLDAATISSNSPNPRVSSPPRSFTTYSPAGSPLGSSHPKSPGAVRPLVINRWN